MIKRIIYFSTILLLVSCSDATQKDEKMTVKTPKANKIDTLLQEHGGKRLDAYFWMNKRDSKPVLDYIAEENTYKNEYFKNLKPLQNQLIEEFKERIDPNEKSAPFIYNGRTYQSESLKGKDYRITSLIDGDNKTVFIDQNKRAEGKSFYTLSDWSVSPNNQLTAMSEDFVGRRKYQITIRKNEDKTFLTDKIEDTDGSVTWANDNQTIFYVKKDPQTLREYQVYAHKLGTDTKEDRLVFEELDELYYVGVGKTKDNKYIEISLFSTTTSETLFLDANNPTAEPKVFLPREKNHLYSVESHDGGFFVETNKEATNNKLLYFKSWPNNLADGEVIIEPKEDVFLDGFSVFRNYIVVNERKNGLRSLRIIEWPSKKSKYVAFNEETYSTGLAMNDNFDATEIYFSYNSLTTPSTVYKYNLEKDTKEEFFKFELLDKSFSPNNYKSERVWATATDGTKVPVSLVYKKGIDLKKAPLLLYGYGSYGVTIPTGFNPVRLSLIDRGFVYAIAHIRGGKYLGEDWYQNGKLLKKKNSFTDFIDCAKYLKKAGYCSPDKVYAQGGSAGGLLMGAVTNMAPEEFKGIVSQVPFVDVMSTMLDESLPLTVGEYEEWGNPNEKESYDYMLSYSPYDNIEAKAYPSILITTGYHDSQVQYWEPLKYIAKMRELKTDNNVIVFDCNMDAGHGGGSGRSTYRKETAQLYSFLLGLEGIEK